jgi:hypothetical protein
LDGALLRESINDSQNRRSLNEWNSPTVVKGKGEAKVETKAMFGTLADSQTGDSAFVPELTAEDFVNIALLTYDAGDGIISPSLSDDEIILHMTHNLEGRC